MKNTKICLAVAMVVALMVGAALGSRNTDKSACQLASESGMCLAHIPRWFFDKESGECRTFIYGGCGGNANRFGSKARCESICKAI